MSNRATHWCYACWRPIRLRGQDIICPNCNDGFIQEISDIGGMLNTYGIFEPDFDECRDRRFRMMEAMSGLMQQRMAEMGSDRVFGIHGTQGASTERGRQSAVGVIGADLGPVARDNDGGSQERRSSFSFLWPFVSSSSNSSSYYQYEGSVGEPAVYDDPSNQMTYSEWFYDH